MHIKIPADLQDEYVEFMRPFIMLRIAGLRTYWSEPKHTQAGDSSLKRSAPQEFEVGEHEHGSIKQMRLDAIEPLRGVAIGEPNEAGLIPFRKILRGLLPSFDSLPSEYKDAIHQGIRELSLSHPDSVDPVPTKAGNSSQDLKLVGQHGSIKKIRFDAIEPLEVVAIGEPNEVGLTSDSILRELLPSFDSLPSEYKDAIHQGIRELSLSRPDSVDPVPTNAGNSSPVLEVVEKRGSIKKMRLDEDEIDPLEGGAIGEPDEAGLDSSLILREIMPSFDTLPSEYKDAINKGIRELLEEFEIPVVLSSVRVPSHFVDGLKGWLCDQLRMCLPDAELNDV
ncbi:hypothetical protein HDU98_002661 [Podochytrium sp. JEL0797]|nr:hypothetical protein HDU98_002661 [Podochytrium sp. JEL0797]